MKLGTEGEIASGPVQLNIRVSMFMLLAVGSKAG